MGIAPLRNPLPKWEEQLRAVWPLELVHHLLYIFFWFIFQVHCVQVCLIATKFLLNTSPTDKCAKSEASQIIKIHFMNWIYYITFLIFVSGQSHENQALSHGETANHNSTIKLQENFVSNDIREDNETVIESTIDEEISSSSVATRSTIPFIF